jgi:parallel beta-helix repeat protein
MGQVAATSTPMTSQTTRVTENPVTSYQQSIRNFENYDRTSEDTMDWSASFESSGWSVEKPEKMEFAPVPIPLSPGTPHVPIVITNNGDFETQAWPGNGTSGFPYVINDLEIDATAASPGISISGTDVYFEISDCVINGSYEASTGIVLNSVANAYIYNNTFFEGDIGILLNQTDGISVVENQCYSMKRAGIYLDDSDDNTIQRNFVVDSWDGIFLERSSLNYVDENFCAGNEWGIDLYWMSNENDVYNNTLISNSEYGILLAQECTLNTIELNYLDGNGDVGILLEESDENTIVSNMCDSNFIEIVLDQTELNVIDNNTLFDTGGSEGLVLFECNDTLVINNTLITIEFALLVLGCSGIDLIDNNLTHFDEGLILVTCDDILVQDCYFDSVYNTYGITAVDSTNLDIIDSYFYQTMTLLEIMDCETVNIIGNECDDYLGGVIILGSNSTTIQDNLIQFGDVGIVSDTCYDMVIHNNTVQFHMGSFAVGVFGSPDAIVTSNNCTANTVALSVITCEGILIEDNFCYMYEQGIDVTTSNYTTISGNHVQEGFTGINVVNSSYVDILDNDVIDNIEGPTGIHLTNCGDSLISGNNLTGNEVPSIYLETSPYCNVTHNVISDTIDGIVLGDSNYTIITDNHITMGQGYGIGVWGSSFCFVSRNHIANISGWEGWALICDGIENELTYNLCDNSTVGIFVETAAGSMIEHNSVHGNDEAIMLNPSCTNATVSWNIFEDNIHNGMDNSTTSTIDYNYWSDYVGTDGDSDGIGDTPHPIDGTANNNDTHPLVFYPTVPSWLIDPADQDHEYGHDFEYTVEVLSPTGIAPISEWWIDDDSTFDIDDGVITNNVALDLGEYPLEVRVYNIYGFYLSGTFTVTVNDTVAPTTTSSLGMVLKSHQDPGMLVERP